MEFTRQNLLDLIEHTRHTAIGMSPEDVLGDFMQRGYKSGDAISHAKDVAFPAKMAPVVAALRAGRMVDHTDRIQRALENIHDSETGIAYLRLISGWRAKRFGMRLDEAREMELNMLMEHGKRYGPRQGEVCWIFTGDLSEL